MATTLDRLLPLWRRTASLGWPIAIQQSLNTLMRTVDIIVTGLFSPAAVAAVGLADLYADIPRRIGSALGVGAIALASQDTGRGATATRDQAITQALLLAALAGLPFVVIGLLFAHVLIAVLGAESDVVRLGATYLGIVFAVAPMRIVGYVGASALQGTGDTRTPMYVNGTANVINIGGTIGLGLGVGALPELGIVGVGLATAIARTFEAGAILLAISSPRTPPSFARPRSLTVARQLLAIGTPRFAEQMSTSLASFPFNALLLTFGTEVVAAYHIGRRIYQQVAGPLYRSISTAASIIVGQTLGRGEPEEARFAGLGIAAFGVATLGATGVVLFVGATPLAHVFSNDPLTIRYATEFTRAFAVAMAFFGVFFTLAGGLRGAGDTRTPFYAQFTGQFGFTLGFSYVAAIVLGYGLVGIYAGIVLTYVWGTLVVSRGFLWGSWAERAAGMMDARAAADD